MSSITSTLPALGKVRSVVERTWDRIDRFNLRLQGRLDTPGYDRWLPYGFAVAQAAILIVLVLARYDSLDHGLETAKYSQAAWQIGEGLKPVTTLAGGNLLTDQGSLVLYPLGLLTSVLPRIETLLVIKSLALAITIIPLWRLARHHGLLGMGATSTIVFAYSIYTYVHNMNIADFAPAVLAVPALMWAVLAGFDEKKRIMTAAIVFALCCRADLGLAIAGLGILLLIERRRRVGLIALLLGFGWFLVAMYGLQRWLGDGDFGFLAPYAAFGDTPLGAFWGIVSHPVQFAKTVGTLPNFQILVTLLAPVLFLPLTAPRYLLPAVPLYVLYMGADVPFGRLREAAQTVPMTVFIFVATVFALKRSGRILVNTVRVERRIILALLLTALVFFVRDSSTSPYQSPWNWGALEEIDVERISAVELIPPESEGAPVRASASLLPLLSERLGVYALDVSVGKFDPENPEIPIPMTSREDIVVAAATADVDWLIIDRDFEDIDANINEIRLKLAQIGWQLQSGAVGEQRVEVFQFTGLIAAVTGAAAEPPSDFGFGAPPEDEPDDSETNADDADTNVEGDPEG